MSESAEKSQESLYRELSSIDSLLQQMGVERERWGHESVTRVLRDLTAELRRDISLGRKPDTSVESLRRRVDQQLTSQNRASLVPVLNLTGTVLHTNLGRASLPAEALDAIVTVAGSPSNLEFDLVSGKRGDRDSHIEALICELTGAQAATVVNNNAAAVLLVLNTFAMQREVPVSRGELVEIGGSFRIPEVMSRSGCTLVEIGATNRTHLKDYREAINANTALLMKVHTSNYALQGFTASVDESELAALAAEHQLPFVVDLGSGNLVDFAALGLPDEPTAATAIANGADLITFSGDKLLGGPQAGLIVGRADLIEAIKQNPLKRALRLDKMTLAALEAVLKLYRDPQRLCQRLPALRLLTRKQAAIRAQALALLPALQDALAPRFEVTVVDCHSQIGSGSLPVETLASAALRIAPVSGEDSEPRELADRLRQLDLPIIGRLHKSALWLDLRCLEPDMERVFLAQLASLTL